MVATTSSQTERISEVIRAFDEQGWHRTATGVDDASAHWLANEVRAAGLEPAIEPFRLSRVDPGECFIEIEGRRVAGVPQFDGTFTDAAGVPGRIGPAGSEAAIGLLEAPVNTPLAGAFRDARRAERHAALVAVTRGGRPGLALFNAPSFTEPFGPPVLQVSSAEGAWLAERAAAGVTAHIAVHAERTEREALNVVARWAGTNPALPPLVAITPRSGWWGCASERGGGLACWLELMRAVRERGTRRDVIFLASSGHELGHLGLHAFLARRPVLARDAHAWVHFGANIGAAQEGGGRLIASDDRLDALAFDALAAAGVAPVIRAPRGTVPAGEAHPVHVAGGRYISLTGRNALFHLEADRWPGALDARTIAAHARATAEVLLALANDDA